MKEQNKNVQIFISYHNKDSNELNTLVNHLAVLKENGFEFWHKGNVLPGESILEVTGSAPFS